MGRHSSSNKAALVPGSRIEDERYAACSRIAAASVVNEPWFVFHDDIIIIDVDDQIQIHCL